MRVHIGTDHAGFELKEHLVGHLRAAGHEVVDHGAHVYDAADDYPPFCLRAAQAVAAEPGTLGIVIGGSGNGEQLAANAVPGIRAALAWSVQTAQLAREHNDAQVVGIGARMHDLETAAQIADAFVTTEFSNDPRHVRRIEMLTRFEETGELPPLPGEPA
ncbi:ribose-5-phosphate isomerase [Kineococcus glutinatus]|uniref:Ribose-5-phosphate isomerase B n=1 Tax=Kineococcus glutinatus TaxID=1070872 RepID=A0ABP8VKY7_9ACTN